VGGNGGDPDYRTDKVPLPDVGVPLSKLGHLFGSNGNGDPGRGAMIEAAFKVTPGEKLYIVVGENGNYLPGAFPGGGYGHAGGGGATLVATERPAPKEEPETTLSGDSTTWVRWCEVPKDALLLVAGAGGAAAVAQSGGGGGGGGDAGGLNVFGIPEVAGEGHSGGGPRSGGGGGGGTDSSGGGAGSHPGCGSEPRTDGAYLVGGHSRGSTGGGGAGYYGGGAGGGGDCFLNTGNGGGGGGSSYVNLSRAVFFTPVGHIPPAPQPRASLQIFAVNAPPAPKVRDVAPAMAGFLGSYQCSYTRGNAPGKARLEIGQTGGPINIYMPAVPDLSFQVWWNDSQQLFHFISAVPRQTILGSTSLIGKDGADFGPKVSLHIGQFRGLTLIVRDLGFEAHCTAR
jgi:hypothetical protein